MTDESKRMSFSQMCAALPEDFSWGDSLTPDVFQHIECAIVQAARTSPTADDAKTWKHAANEWADAATSGLVWLRNIRDNVSIPTDAINNMEKLISHAREEQPTADDAKLVGEAVAWLWNEKPCEFNDYQSRPRVTFVRPKNTEAPGGMQALGVIAAAAVQPAKDSGDAQDSVPEWALARSGSIRAASDAAKMALRDYGLKGKDSGAFDFNAGFQYGTTYGKAIAAIASAEREGK